MSQPPDRLELRPSIQPEYLNAAELLSPLYTRATTYVDEARRTVSGVDVAYTVRPEQCNPSIRQMLRGTYGLRSDGAVTNRYIVGQQHTDGHIIPLALYPGWQGEQSIIEAAQQEEDYWVDEIGLIRFSRPIFPSNEVVAAVSIIEERGSSLVVDGDTAKEGETMFHTQVRNMVLSPVNGRHSEGVLLHGQLLEHQAQAAGMEQITTEGLPEGKIIVYIAVMQGRYAQTYIRPGETIVSHAELVASDTRTKTFQVVTRRRNDTIASGRVRIGITDFLPIQELAQKESEQNAS